jgi:hypothetical protein
MNTYVVKIPQAGKNTPLKSRDMSEPSKVISTDDKILKKKRINLKREIRLLGLKP